MINEDLIDHWITFKGKHLPVDKNGNIIDISKEELGQFAFKNMTEVEILNKDKNKDFFYFDKDYNIYSYGSKVKKEYEDENVKMATIKEPYDQLNTAHTFVINKNNNKVYKKTHIDNYGRKQAKDSIIFDLYAKPIESKTK